MYIVIARYAGMAGKIATAAPKVQQGLVPMLKDQPGFLGYAALASEQGDVVAIGIWKDAAAMTNARSKIGAWVTGNLTGFDEPTERFHGAIGTHAIAEPQSGGQSQSLYCLVRKAEGLSDKALQDEARNAMLAAAQKAPGFRGIYYVRSAENPSQGASVLLCDTREHATAIHEETMAISKQQQPHVSVRVAASGQTAVLAMA
jgi:heme-degrading monooxygenase HmoA